ncbi:D-tyrosyl-tRNA(Tyr) deacylase [bacterium]|nr:D-tyrosyl-tRNA(Tyr) deacylase [bacterium]
MRALIQRVSSAAVRINGVLNGQIGQGLVILLGIRREDDENEMSYLADKCVNLRIFEDDAGKMNLSLKDIGGELLVISQFTLHADTQRGRRPSFINAAPPEISEPLYEKFIEYLRSMQLRVETGVFGAHMAVEIHNDGPVTIMVHSKNEYV